MKKILLGLFCLTASVSFGQVKIVKTTDLVTDVNNTTIEAIGNASDFEIEQVLWVVNIGLNSISLKCKKTEIDVVSNTENTTCWKLCPSTYDLAGAVPSAFVTLGGNQMVESAAVGDTIKSFAGHYKPKNIDGCSMFRYDWYDVNDLNTPVASVTVKYIHTTGVCTVGVSEFEEVNLSVSPNPANNWVSLSLSDNLSMEQLTIDVYDLLGKKVDAVIFEKGNSSITINTEMYNEGVYFLSLKSNGDIVKSSKLIVRH